MGACQSAESACAMNGNEAPMETVPTFSVPDSLVGLLKELQDIYARSEDKRAKINELSHAIQGILDGLLLPDSRDIHESDLYRVSDIQGKAANLIDVVSRLENDPLALSENYRELVENFHEKIVGELNRSFTTEEERETVLAELTNDARDMIERVTRYTRSAPALIGDGEEARENALKLQADVASFNAVVDALKALPGKVDAAIEAAAAAVIEDDARETDSDASDDPPTYWNVRKEIVVHGRLAFNAAKRRGEKVRRFNH